MSATREIGEEYLKFKDRFLFFSNDPHLLKQFLKDYIKHVETLTLEGMSDEWFIETIDQVLIHSYVARELADKTIEGLVGIDSELENLFTQFVDAIVGDESPLHEIVMGSLGSFEDEFNNNILRIQDPYRRYVNQSNTPKRNRTSSDKSGLPVLPPPPPPNGKNKLSTAIFPRDAFDDLMIVYPEDDISTIAAKRFLKELLVLRTPDASVLLTTNIIIACKDRRIHVTDKIIRDANRALNQLELQAMEALFSRFNAVFEIEDLRTKVQGFEETVSMLSSLTSSYIKRNGADNIAISLAEIGEQMGKSDLHLDALTELVFEYLLVNLQEHPLVNKKGIGRLNNLIRSLEHADLYCMTLAVSLVTNPIDNEGMDSVKSRLLRVLDGFNPHGLVEEICNREISIAETYLENLRLEGPVTLLGIMSRLKIALEPSSTGATRPFERK